MSLGTQIFLFIVSLVLLSTVTQFLAQRAARKSEGQPAPALPGELGDAVKGDVIVWFHAPGCAPCRAMKPTVEALGDKARIIDVSQDMHTAQAFGVMATPTTVVIRAGQIAAVRVGAMSPSALAAL